MDIVQTYGHQGPQAGDELVADLLQRTVDGQWSAGKALDETLAVFSAKATSLVLTELPLMTVKYAQQLADIRWQIATVFLDGMVVTHRDAPALPKDAYAYTDALCDKARQLTQQAVQSQANYKNGGKVRLIAVDELENFVLNEGIIMGVWNVFEAIVLRVETVLTSVTTQQRPQRFDAFIEQDVRLARAQVEAFRLLRSEWHANRLAQNRLELARDAASYVKDLYKLLQQFWAPYLRGPEYSALLKQKMTLAELSVADPWVLTDKEARVTKEKSAESCQELADFWSSLQDPDATIRLAEQVQELLKKRVLRRRTGRGYPNVPWPSQYLVRYAFTIDAASFDPGDLVVFYASSDATGRIGVQLRRAGKLTRITDLLGVS